MLADLAERVQVGVIGVLTKGFMFFIEHHLRGGKLDREGTNPPYTIVFMTKPAPGHLIASVGGVIVKGVKSVALRFSMVADHRRSGTTPR